MTAPSSSEPSFTATPVQEKLMDCVTDGRFNYIGFGGGVRGTKTWGSLAVLIALCRIFPGSRWAVVRKDLERLRRTTVPSFNKLRKLAGGFVGPINGQTWEATCTNGSVILFRGENIDRDPDLDAFDGYEVNGFLFEEGDELAEATFYKGIERAGAWIVPEGDTPPPYVLVTFNPNTSWPKRVFFDPWEAGTIAPPYAFIPATIADNPYAPDAYRESLKHLPPEEYRLRVLGDWTQLEGRYYDSLGQAHLLPRGDLPEEWPDWWEYWGAFDWGYAHWAVFGAFGRDPDGNTYLLDSVWMRKEQDDRLAGTIATVLPGPWLGEVYAGQDCFSSYTARGATGITTAEVFEDAGIYLIPADDDRVNGGRAVRRALQLVGEPPKPRTFLVDTASNRRVFDQLRAALPDPNNVNKPLKVDCDSEGRGGDDGADMFRYGLASRVPTPAAPALSPEERAARARLDPVSRREAESFDQLAEKYANRYARLGKR